MRMRREARVLPFPGHHWARGGAMPPDFCTVCGGWGTDGSLPVHCPGRPMTQGELGLVEVGELNYLGGRWIGATWLQAPEVAR